ncbi:MAG: tetratricopeptide repeat protein, partial [Rhodospirillaceae bacterium]|nr:tetratricopeptide repeat protein [Rhodospirillaceae bacterium]
MSKTLYDQFFLIVLAAILALTLSVPSATAQRIKSAKENVDRIQQWNNFADGLFLIHQKRLETIKIKTSERLGGYKGMPNYFRDVEYRNATNDRLLSRIRWEQKRPNTAQIIEVFFYDKQGRVYVDFLASYMVGYRNAPFQTLINVHAHDSDLSAFRQFDASGDRIFEKCEGQYFDKKVEVYLDEIDIPPDPSQVSDELYASCFGLLPITADRYMKPASLLPSLQRKTQMKENDGELTHEKLEYLIANQNRRIKASPDQGHLYLKRGKYHLMLQRFDRAIDDFTKALSLDDSLDAAYFGRGMAYGRNKELKRGIDDLGVFIQRNPKSSLAYTKRGVRYIWNKDFKRARDDLMKAISLNPNNAEAHDDLGVALAQLGQIEKAVGHFIQSKTLDPSYQKAHHNLAMVLYMLGDLDRALPVVNDALRLAPNSRGSLLLKSSILDGLGKKQEATALKDRAEFLTD